MRVVHDNINSGKFGNNNNTTIRHPQLEKNNSSLHSIPVTAGH